MSYQKVANLSELAKLAGVSASTVSRALAGSDLINVKTRERIVALAVEHGFTPNESARNLRLQRTLSIAVVVPLGHEIGQSFSDPFFTTMLGHLADGLAARGYDLTLKRVIPVDDMWLQRIIQSGRVDGILVIGQSNQSHVLNRAAQSYSPLVVWGASEPDTDYCCVGGDNHRGGALAARHLIDKGRRNLIFLGNSQGPEFAERERGFTDACIAHGIEHHRALEMHLTPEAAYAALVEYFGQGEMPDGIVAVSDIIAMSTIRALRERNFNVPEDVSVIGYDDVPLAQYTAPPLTTIRQDLAQAADRMIDLLFRRMAGEAGTSITLPPALIERASA